MSILQIRREDARVTIVKLMATHHETLNTIEYGGKKFWKDGVDITQEVRKNVLIELGQCRIGLDALDALQAGDVQRANNLFSHIQERTFAQR